MKTAHVLQAPIRNMYSRTELLLNNKLDRKAGLRDNLKDAKTVTEYLQKGAPLDGDYLHMLISSLTISFALSVEQMNKKGPVMVRVTDFEQIMTYLMPNGVPEGPTN